MLSVRRRVSARPPFCTIPRPWPDPLPQFAQPPRSVPNNTGPRLTSQPAADSLRGPSNISANHPTVRPERARLSIGKSSTPRTSAEYLKSAPFYFATEVLIQTKSVDGVSYRHRDILLPIA